MGNALQAQENVTGAVQFYSYALLLYPQYTEAYHSLLVVKCRNLTQQKLDSLEVIQNFVRFSTRFEFYKAEFLPLHGFYADLTQGFCVI